MLTSEYHNATITLILWHATKENDVRLYSGTLRAEDREWVAVNEEMGWRLPLDEELQLRIRPVADEEEKRILRNADYGLSLRVGDLPGDTAAGLNPTGIRWED